MKKVLKYAIVMFGLCLMTQGLKAQEWYEKVKISGDFRNRFEYIDDDSVKVGDEVIKRYRDRIRFRIGGKADIGKDVKVGFRLATGESSDPISTNQTLTSGNSKKGIMLDLAYAEYKASETSALKGMQAVIGKMENPFYKPGGSDLIWDNDLTPEGVYTSYTMDFGDAFKMKGLLGGYFVEERSKDVDSGMLAAELIASYKATDKLNFDLGLSYFNYGNAKEFGSFYDSTKGYGNSVNAAVAPATTVTYKSDFDLIDVGFEVVYQFDFAPLKFYAEYVSNSGAEGDLDTGYIFGLSLGKINGPKTWMVSYSYRKLEADATVGAFADSDISGGGTDIQGSRVSGEYAIFKNWTVVGTLFMGDKKISSSSEVSYTRFQFDLNFKF